MQSGGALGVDQLAIARDLEHAATGTDQLDVRVRVLLPDVGLQLEGAGFVPSGVAVLDGYVHV